MHDKGHAGICTMQIILDIASPLWEYWGAKGEAVILKAGTLIKVRAFGGRARSTSRRKISIFPVHYRKLSRRLALATILADSQIHYLSVRSWPTRPMSAPNTFDVGRSRSNLWRR